MEDRLSTLEDKGNSRPVYNTECRIRIQAIQARSDVTSADRWVIFAHTVLDFVRVVPTPKTEEIRLETSDRTLAHDVGMGRVSGQMVIIGISKVPSLRQSMLVRMVMLKCMTRRQKTSSICLRETLKVPLWMLDRFGT